MRTRGLGQQRITPETLAPDSWKQDNQEVQIQFRYLRGAHRAAKTPDFTIKSAAAEGLRKILNKKSRKDQIPLQKDCSRIKIQNTVHSTNNTEADQSPIKSSPLHEKTPPPQSKQGERKRGEKLRKHLLSSKFKGTKRKMVSLCQKQEIAIDAMEIKLLLGRPAQDSRRTTYTLPFPKTKYKAANLGGQSCCRRMLLLWGLQGSIYRTS
ncbi:hypothetical protein B296_00029499 [Ensete ventricosum]|uniref:Uncharacterized protein n=1 Tax=Ensete ventricosum TaxID=4639 RepID=A0A427AIQ1_ENSVE|nr:hypothetical protein B296_00029499 [Ensete ventricosum]